jgi:SMI1 / KNR4 family (SUKH-1)
MYLAKFFHRPPGDDDRELLLIPGGRPMIIGIRMHGSVETQTEDFLREEFSDIGDAVATYRRHAAELVTAGYMETTHTRYTRRNLLSYPEAKREWQKGLDELMLAALSAPLEEQTRRLAALEDTPAAREPLYLWLAAHRGIAAGDDNERTIRFAEEARDTLASRRAGKTPHYAWSIAESDLEARIFEVLSWAQLRADDPMAALDAIEQAYRISPSQDRGVQRATILCDHFPERQEEAFDAAHKYAEHGGYEEITALPAYAAYVARCKHKPKSDAGWRWKTKKPATEADLRQAEQQLGATLPDDYRRFLTTFGQTELSVRLSDQSGELCFHRPSELATQRDNLFNFVTRTGKDPEKISAYFRQEHGVSLRDLVPVAEPAQESRCLVIHLEQGDRFGWCFHWDHDGAWELEHPTPSFDAALEALTDGIKRRDTALLSFLGVYID